MDSPEAPPAPAAIGTPLELRCGLTLRNRLCKAATSEHLGTPRTNDATPRLVRLYERWGAGGFGLIITGNVMVCRSRSGRQSPVAASWARPRAPSAVPLRLAGVGPPLHRSPVAMAAAEVEDVVEAFGDCAGRCAALGFDGVQVHAAHGYLLSQFLSPRGNARRDAYGGDAARRSRALLLACRAARRAMGPGKLLAVKVNASDFEAGGFDRDGAAAVVRALAADEAPRRIELSGGARGVGMACLGDAHDFAGADARGALFATLARDLRRHARGVAVMLTGGAGPGAARAGAADLVGVCRAARA
ncbi:FMN binding protein [Aureococcus anophagefferens]|nr:FMN binding protein [Aureococcus anophagefferens]